MNLTRKERQELTSATMVPTLGLMLACSGLCVLTAYAADPSWWSWPGAEGQPSAVATPQVVTNNGVVSTNYLRDDAVVVTQGQLKHFTVRAVDELNANLPGGAGAALTTLVNNWQQDYLTNNYNNPTNAYAPYNPRDFTAMNVGQLKYIGNLVWARLVAGGFTNAAPWWLAQNTNTDGALANLGQLKEVFAFDLQVTPPAAPSGLVVTASNPGELDLTWMNNSPNARTLTILESTNGGVTWSTVATLSDTTINSYAVTGQSGGAEFQIVASNSAGTNATPPSSSTPSPPVPRYAVIDFGTNFYPAGINNSGAVVGRAGSAVFAGTGAIVPAIWSWTSNAPQTLPANPNFGVDITNYYAIGIDDAGNIAGEVDANLTPGYYAGCYWANATSTPSVLGGITIAGNYSQDEEDYEGWDSNLLWGLTYVDAISDQGFIVGSGLQGPDIPWGLWQVLSDQTFAGV